MIEQLGSHTKFLTGSCPVVHATLLGLIYQLLYVVRSLWEAEARIDGRRHSYRGVQPAYPQMFEREAAAIRAVLGEPSITIEHHGSTAVPGLPAKPVIDLMVAVIDLNEAERHARLLIGVGNEPVDPTYRELMPDRVIVIRREQGAGRCHVHLILRDGDEYRRNLAFRDHLRAHPTVAAEYASLKRRSAYQHRGDREAYRRSKSDFIDRVTDAALRKPGRVVPTLFLMCGLPGSGKTTTALALERDHNAVRLAPDVWMARIVGDGWDHERRERVEEVQWALAERFLTLGLSVALENGFWRRTEREAHRTRASELGADSSLIFCDATRDELKRRLVARNADLPPDTFVVTPEQLDEMWPHFEPPSEDELR
jgi:GrpB-like predicted nucleotidyltransferase (UPF0157 family)/predicted kinase